MSDRSLSHLSFVPSLAFCRSTGSIFRSVYFYSSFFFNIVPALSHIQHCGGYPSVSLSLLFDLLVQFYFLGDLEDPVLRRIRFLELWHSQFFKCYTCETTSAIAEATIVKTQWYSIASSLSPCRFGHS